MSSFFSDCSVFLFCALVFESNDFKLFLFLIEYSVFHVCVFAYLPNSRIINVILVHSEGQYHRLNPAASSGASSFLKSVRIGLFCEVYSRTVFPREFVVLGLSFCLADFQSEPRRLSFSFQGLIIKKFLRKSRSERNARCAAHRVCGPFEVFFQGYSLQNQLNESKAH